jgi:hypothetical protein
VPKIDAAAIDLDLIRGPKGIPEARMRHDRDGYSATLVAMARSKLFAGNTSNT